MADDDPDADLIDAALDTLYGGLPDEFMHRRTELAKQARDDGQPAAAKRIGALRKPTVAASIVNRLVRDDPSAVQRLVDLGDRLRQAHHALDAGELRELSTERRTLVGELTRAALELSGQRDPSVAVRDDVVSTLDAAVADPDVAERLGSLTRPEHWSGFGVAPSGAPELTLVRGGKDEAPRDRARDRGKRGDDGDREREQPAEPTVSAATRRRLQRALDKARAAFDTAEDALTAADTAERETRERVQELTTELAALQRELDEAKSDLEHARREAKSARTRRREARSALDRAERQQQS